ncbi:MAG: hypothetical protein KF684_04215 [Phycisphaeraceae bacterium]|nr:hypothetical protein [Phycisphaeraceae bacterium]
MKPTLSPQEAEQVRGVMDAHRAVLLCTDAMRTFGTLTRVVQCDTAEHLVEAMRISGDFADNAEKIVDRYRVACAALRERSNALSDRGLHYRGLSDEGKALLVVRR